MKEGGWGLWPVPIKVEKEQTTIWLLKRTVHMEILYCLDSTWYSFLFRYFVWKLPSTTSFWLKNNSLRLFHSSTPSGSFAKLAQMQHNAFKEYRTALIVFTFWSNSLMKELSTLMHSIKITLTEITEPVHLNIYFFKYKSWMYWKSILSIWVESFFSVTALTTDVAITQKPW